MMIVSSIMGARSALSTNRREPAFARPLFPRLLIATRPWSFPAALSPLMITFSLLWVSSNLSPLSALSFTVGIVALQGAANLLNSYCDFTSGLDKCDTAGDRTMVDSLVTRREFPYLFAVVLAIWFVSFLTTLPFKSSYFPHYLGVYLIGVILSIIYSAGSPPLKHIGFGDVVVFMSFGPLLVVAAAMSCSIDPLSVNFLYLLLQTTPAAMLVVAILHANNHRDLRNDELNSAKTVSVRLGSRLSRFYFYILVLLPPIVSLAMAMLVGYTHPLHGAGVVVLPLTLRLCKLVGSAKIPRDIDAETAKVMLLYGITSSIGILLANRTR